MPKTLLWASLLLALAACQKATDPAAPPPAPASADAPKATGPTPARQGLTAEGALQVSAEDVCPVCGMMPQAHPKFASGMTLADGRTFYFCGTGCFLRGHLHPDTYLGEGATPARETVPEYFGGEPIDASAAWWVYGSDVVGPMGPAFVPLKTQADLTVFRQRHGGAHTFQLGQLTPEKFGIITGKPSLRGKGGGAHRGH